MKRIALFFLLIFLFENYQFAQNAPNYHFKNGYWFNGKDFTHGDWYSVGGLLTQKTPSKVDSVIDLENHFVAPPMADVFCSSVAGNPQPKFMLESYRDEGVFYLMIANNTQEEKARVQEALAAMQNPPEVVFGNGGVTCTLGKPFLQYEPQAAGLKKPQDIQNRYAEIRNLRKMQGNAYWFVDNKADLKRDWDAIKKQHPEVIYIYLLDAKNNGGKEGKGLSADMAKAIVKKARKADIRVIAHVETAADAELAISLKVNGLANLPGNEWDGNGDVKNYEMSDDLLKKMAKKGIFVAPVFAHSMMIAPNNAAVKEFQKRQLERLYGFGVQVVLGSDDVSRTIRSEVAHWFQLGNFNIGKIIQTMCEHSPKAIFPDRKIGKIAEGHEASFIVVYENPLSNLLKIRAIDFKVQKGRVIENTRR